MLTLRKIDLVQIKRALPPGAWNDAEAALLAALGPWKQKADKKFYRKIFTLMVLGRKVTVGLHSCYKNKWIDYQFNGDVQLKQLHTLTESLGPWSFASIAGTGQVSRLEFAVDRAGMLASDFIAYLPGIKQGRVLGSSWEGGCTQYLGALSSPRKMCVYDKAAEMKAKGKQCQVASLLRTELRISSPSSLVETLKAFGAKNGFEGLLLVPVQSAIDCTPAPLLWKKFLAACQTSGGVVSALKVCGSSRKTLITHLKKLADTSLCPSTCALSIKYLTELESAIGK